MALVRDGSPRCAAEFSATKRTNVLVSLALFFKSLIMKKDAVISHYVGQVPFPCAISRQRRDVR